jgi:hypothetical protein
MSEQERFFGMLNGLIEGWLSLSIIVTAIVGVFWLFGWW